MIKKCKLIVKTEFWLDDNYVTKDIPEIDMNLRDIFTALSYGGNRVFELLNNGEMIELHMGNYTIDNSHIQLEKKEEPKPVVEPKVQQKFNNKNKYNNTKGKFNNKAQQQVDKTPEADTSNVNVFGIPEEL